MRWNLIFNKILKRPHLITSDLSSHSVHSITNQKNTIFVKRQLREPVFHWKAFSCLFIILLLTVLPNALFRTGGGQIVVLLTSRYRILFFGLLPTCSNMNYKSWNLLDFGMDVNLSFTLWQEHNHDVGRKRDKGNLCSWGKEKVTSPGSLHSVY